jgi:AcrR family transcriptional regulator
VTVSGGGTGTQEPRAGRPRATPRRPGDPEPRQQILDAAGVLLAEHGIAGTSTRAIAEAVGIRQASLYYHFAGKDEILLELLEASVTPTLAHVPRLLAHPDRPAALFALAAIDVATLLGTPSNVGSLYLSHEVQRPEFDGFRALRAELRSAYVTLAGGSDFDGAACLQLVEMVIPWRRDGDPGPDAADRIAGACLRVVGLSEPAVARAVAASRHVVGAKV